ncbi:DUF4270 domain-containing protein [Winogradskyella flava]|uniref:DUF4270 domain-containing protein n=1 Tax=Winogradskyella flava TaxID=1884876 RepID=A0A842ILH2_9FLAO|nr:DUF4270 domain-containing protein [Winogradskyella flava]MBC2843561.1 DUF4270 domain-containing protein [Winogradskyella flava]
MKKNKFALQILAFALILTSFIACDKDFSNLESDILNSDIATNFDITSDTWEVITYTENLDPVQTNNLPVNSLGIYDDFYGRTTSSFVTQLTPGAFDPDFGEEEFQQIDSVVLNLPYFFSVTEVDEEGDFIYDVDSIIPEPTGSTYKPIRLRIFENNYFIRDFDPTADFNQSQAYFSNFSASSTETITALEGEELTIIPAPQTSYIVGSSDNQINISEQGYNLETIDDNGDVQISERLSPRIRLKLDPDYWQNKIIVLEGDAVLSNTNNFADYFRGLYFKAEPINDDGSLLILNTSSQNANITIYYTRLTPSTTDDATATQQDTFVLNFGTSSNSGTSSINFFVNDFTTPIADGNPDAGDSRIYLKGGAGAIGKIKLFKGDDINDGDDMTFDTWKSAFVETDQEGNFVRSKRLVNEANLVFYVDENLVNTADAREPDRIFLYDVDNKRPLVDYFLDGINNSFPLFSVANHLGPLERDGDESDGNGIKYKLRITEHINNLLVRDSTNVELGLSTSLNVNLEESITQRQVQSTEDSDLTIPVSSVMSPRGTVLHGNNTEDLSKKVYLEIFYTCTEENDCIED